jgi:hypothetical protein
VLNHGELAQNLYTVGGKKLEGNTNNNFTPEKAGATRATELTPRRLPQ